MASIIDVYTCCSRHRSEVAHEHLLLYPALLCPEERFRRFALALVKP